MIAASLPAVTTALYRALLGRDPDAAAHEGVTARLRLKGLEAGLEETARALLETPEYRGRLAGQLAAATPRQALVEGRPPFCHVLSLGTHCYTAAMLDRAGLRRWSGPFDWIFSSPPMVRHCLSTQFATYLDRSHYRPVPVEDRPDPLHGRCEHLFYRERFGIRRMFNHHDAADEHYPYVQRCVARFRAAVEEPALLVQCTLETDTTLTEFRRLARAISSLYPAATLLVVAIATERASGHLPGLRRAAHVGRHEMHRLQPVSTWQPLAFIDPVDELAILRLIRRHPLAITGPMEE